MDGRRDDAGSGAHADDAARDSEEDDVAPGSDEGEREPGERERRPEPDRTDGRATRTGAADQSVVDRDAADRIADDRDAGDRPADDDDAPDRPADRSSRVHVRRLDVLDTLRWSWGVARRRRELFAVALVAGLPTVVAMAGVTRPAPTADIEVADWVLPAYLAQLLAGAVAAGVVSLTAADAVAGETLTPGARPLRDRVAAAVRRLPALVGTALAVAVLLSLAVLPSYAAIERERYLLGLALLVVPAYLLDRLLLAFQACVLDRAGPLASVRAGWRATGESARKVFVVAVACLLVVPVSDYVSAQFGGPYDVVTALVGTAVGAVVFPVFGLALAHLYLESSRNW